MKSYVLRIVTPAMMLGIAFCTNTISSAATITTPFPVSSQFCGTCTVYFDVMNTSGASVTLESWRFHHESTLSFDATLFSRSGTHDGFETTSTGWTDHGTLSGTGGGAGVQTSTFNFPDIALAPGTTSGFAVDMTGTMLYSTTSTPGFPSSGPGNGTFMFGDGTLTLLGGRSGVSDAGPTYSGSPFEPRFANVSIDYSTAAASVPEPSTLTLAALGFLALIRRRRRK